MSTKSYDRLVKILVVGDSGVGKTSLLNRFSDNMFNKNFIPTIGIINISKNTLIILKICSSVI
jgi:GTPase SAR1 family protein